MVVVGAGGVGRRILLLEEVGGACCLGDGRRVRGTDDDLAMNCANEHPTGDRNNT